MFTTHGVDLAIHRETGEVRVLRYAACQDVGRALNPAAVRGQMSGGIAMGVGQALLERMAFGPGGAPTNTTMLDYHVPTSLDAPADPVLIVLESGGGRGPFGSKGVGEASAVAAPIAIANALHDALGVQVSAIPAAAEDLARLLEERDDAPPAASSRRAAAGASPPAPSWGRVSA
jgi:CO/xanthine dehydrogenase Mo-binding subunit